jgi:hypothetical protein
MEGQHYCNGEGQDETYLPADTKEEAARPRLFPLLSTKVYVLILISKVHTVLYF